MIESNQRANPAKARLEAGDVALGMPVRLGRSADIVRIARATGHDFIFIDVQHAIFNLETVANLCNVALALGVAPLVRVRGVNDPDVSMLLDNGATGIVFPDVNTADEARRRGSHRSAGARCAALNPPDGDGGACWRKPSDCDMPVLAAQPSGVSPAGRAGARSASASRDRADPGFSGFCWLSCGAQPVSVMISKVARTRPPAAPKRSA